MKRNTVDYGVILKSTFELMKKNLILFVPNIAMILVSFMLIMIFYHGSGISEVFMNKPFVLDDPNLLVEEFSKLTQKSGFIISAAIWGIGELLFGAFFIVMKYGMIRDVLKKGKTTLLSSVEFAEKHYINYWYIHIVSSLIIYGPVFMLLFVYFLFVKSTLIYVNLTLVIQLLFFIICVAYLFLAGSRLIFVYPVMSFEHEKFFKSLKTEFHYVKTHSAHTMISFLIAIAFILGFKIFELISEGFKDNIEHAIPLFIIAAVIFIIEIIVTTWEHMFIFKSYQSGKHIRDLVKNAIKSGKYVPNKKQSNKTKPKSKNSTKKPKKPKKKS